MIFVDFFVTTIDKISILLRYSLYIHQHCLHRQHNAAVVYDDKTPPIHIIDEWGRVDTHSLLAMVSPQVPSIDDTTKTAIQHVGMREKCRASDSEKEATQYIVDADVTISCGVYH